MFLEIYIFGVPKDLIHKIRRHHERSGDRTGQRRRRCRWIVRESILDFLLGVSENMYVNEGDFMENP